MNLLSPNISFKLTSALSVLLIIGTFLLSGDLTTASLVAIDIFAILALLSSANFLTNFLQKSSEFNLRLAIGLVFLGAIVISFIPYLMSVNSQTNVLLLTSIFSSLYLITIFFTNTKLTK